MDTDKTEKQKDGESRPLEALVMRTLKTYRTYKKHTDDPSKTDNREANLSRNGWLKVTQFDLDEDGKCKHQVAERLASWLRVTEKEYEEAVYWIRYDYWAIPHAFIYIR